MVSHDRTFLNEVCTDVVHLWSRKLAYYSGNYDTFEKANKQTNKRRRPAVPARANSCGGTDSPTSRRVTSASELASEDALG